MRLYVLGDRDTVAGFASAGVRGESPGEGKAGEAFRRIVSEREKTGVLLVTGGVVSELGDSLWEHRIAQGRPLVVEIPGVLEPAERDPDLMAFIREAVGISV